MFYFPSNIKIISGGQTGVDRAALDFALIHNIPCGGWCPKGRLAEDGIISKKYPLNETSNNKYKNRTENNIKDSDATLILYANKIDNGTKLTMDLCKAYCKPMLLINIKDNLTKPQIINWIKSNNIKILNIAGPRESNSPGIYDETLHFLNSSFEIGKKI